MFLIQCWKKLLLKFDSFCSLCMISLVIFYRIFMAGICGMGGCCRFYPSCSEYALFVYKNRPFFEASLLIFKRILKCHPLGPKFRNEPELNCEKPLKNRLS